MSNRSIQQIINDIIEREGGYVDHPDDPGGATCYGVTEHVARANGYTGPMRELPRHLAYKIYEQQYFRRPGFHLVYEVSPAVAEELTDTGVNMGAVIPATFLQRSLNVLNRCQRLYPDLKADGVIGAQTIGALRSYLEARGREGEAMLVRNLNILQGARYFELTERREANEAFYFGWLKHRVAL